MKNFIIGCLLFVFIVNSLFYGRIHKGLLITILVLLVVPSLSKKTFGWVKEQRMMKKLARAGMPDIDRMDGLQFEVYLKALLKELGYKSIVTSGSNDFGADLIMKKDRKKISIQAKRYGYKNRVGIEAIQQVYASKPYYNTDECWVFTNSLYTKSATQLAKACDVKLYDRYALASFINQVNSSVSPKQVRNTVEPAQRRCPVCSGNLVQRTSNKGNTFMGCTNYPDCTHSEPVAK